MPLTNTLKNYEKLHVAGITEDHAKAIAQVIEDAVYQSHEELKFFIKDIFVEFESRIEAKIDNLESKMDEKIDNLELRMIDKIDNLDSKMEAKIGSLESRMEVKMLSIKNETLKWMILLTFLAITAIIAILKFSG